MTAGIRTLIYLLAPVVFTLPAAVSWSAALSTERDPIPASESEVADALSRMVHAAGLTRAAGIDIVALDSGHTLFSQNSNQNFIPASNMKLFIAAASLERLGPDAKVATLISLAPATATIYLKGCGDSSLSSHDLEQMVIRTAALLDKGEVYTLKADLSCFDDKHWGRGWIFRKPVAPERNFISPLSVDGTSLLFQEPAAVAKAKGTGARLSFKMSEAIRFKPRLALQREVSRSGKASGGVSGSGPKCTLYALSLARSWFAREGIQLGEVAVGVMPDSAQELARKERTVAAIVRTMFKDSNNLAAEVLVKLLGRKRTGRAGTSEDGLQEVRDFLKGHGIQGEDLVLADGSGLSQYNAVSPETIIKLLGLMYRRDQFPLYKRLLPVAGRDGTLWRRMRGTAAEGKVSAKTGTLANVSALSGYTTTADGVPVAFSILARNQGGSLAKLKKIEDAIVTLISSCSLTRQLSARAVTHGP